MVWTVVCSGRSGYSGHPQGVQILDACGTLDGAGALDACGTLDGTITLDGSSALDA